MPATAARKPASASISIFSVENPILGTAGGPRAVLDRLGERVLIINGDIVTTMTPGPLWAHHRATGALATLALHDGRGARDYPGLTIDGRGKLIEIPHVARARGAEGEERAAGCFAGVHIVERSVVELVPEGRFCGMVDPIYGSLMEEGLPVHAVALPGSWYEIGTPPRYLGCQLEALRREDLPLAFEGYRRMAPAGYARGLVGWERAGLRPPFMLERGVHLEKGALIEGVVAGAKAYVGHGARVKDSVLLERAWIGTGARVERCIVLEEAVVPEGAHLVDEVVAPPVATGS